MLTVAASFIAHETAVSGDIGAEDGGKFAFEILVSCNKFPIKLGKPTMVGAMRRCFRAGGRKMLAQVPSLCTCLSIRPK